MSRKGEAGTLGDMESSSMNTDTENRPTQLTRLWLDNGGEDIQHWAERLTEQAARAGGTAEEQAPRFQHRLKRWQIPA